MCILRVLICVALQFLCCDFLPFQDNNQKAKIGGHAVFNCPLDFPDGIEIPYILEWEKDNEKILSFYDGSLHAVDTYAGRVKLLHTGELGYGRGSINLTSIRETDNGMFHCLVLFPNRTPTIKNNGTYFFLEVEGGNLIYIPPVNVTCREGEPAEFECVPKNPGSIVKWYKDGDAISDLMDLAFRAVLESNGSLIINPTTMTDPGEYECQVYNEFGQKQYASAYLNVEYKAKVVYAPAEKYFPYGKPASLDCHFRANPPLTNLRWEKDGFLFDPYNVPGVFYSSNGSLFFNRVDETHEGYYSCTPYNKLGTEGPSPKIRVFVQKPAHFLVRPQSIYVTKIGNAIEMACVASDGYADRPPIVSWRRKDGRPLPEDRTSFQNGNMTISDVAIDDRGIYICSASNEADTISAETELMIEHIPSMAPYNLTAFSTKNSLTVRWVLGSIRHNMDVYIWYRHSDSLRWSTAKVVEPERSEATIHDLAPGMTYEIRVLSQDYIGDGLFSKSIFVTTDDDNSFRSTFSPQSQIFPPTNLSASLLPNGILLTWAPPIFGNEQVHHYTVKWYLDDEEERLVGMMDTTNTYFLIPDVEEDTHFAFIVLAVAQNGSQFPSSKEFLYIPAYARIRSALTIFGTVAISIPIVGLIIYFVRKRFSKKTPCKR